MARTRCVDKSGMKKGAWTPEEDSKLIAYITRYGSWNWRQLPRFAGLARCGKSCRLRWLNYLRPNIKRGNYTQEEEDIIVTMHKKIGNKWSVIASNLPGRTDNDIKNHWHSSLKRRSHRRNTRQKVKATAPATAPAAAVAAVNTTTNPNINNNASLQYSPQTSSDTVSVPMSPQLSSAIITTNNHNENNSDYFDDIDFLNYYTQHAIENLWSETFLAEQIDNCNRGFGSSDTTNTQISDSSELLSPQSSSLSSAENNDNLFTFAETTATAFDEEFWTEHYAVDLSCVPNELLTTSVDLYVCPVAVYDDLDLWTQSNFT